MNNRCTVCNHSRAHDINLALLAGTTLDTLKQQFGLSRSALHRHKQHLQRTIDQAEDRLRHNFMLSYLFQLNDYNAAAAATVAAARAEGNARLTLQAANAGARIINTMARFEVDLDHETMYRLLTSPDYVRAGCLLPGDPQILAGPRATLVRSLTAACPETATEALFDPEDVAAFLKRALEPDANTHPPQARQLEFPGFLVPLEGVLPAAPFGPDSMLSDQQSETKRDRSGTDAGQISPLSELNEEKQGDMEEEQISGIELVAGPSPDPLPTAYSPLPTASYRNMEENNSLLETENAERETRRAQLEAMRRLQKHFPDLDFPEVVSETEDRDDEPASTRRAAKAQAPPVDMVGLLPPVPPGTQNSELETAFSTDPWPLTTDHCLDETARRADELFMMAHGYPRNNPPKRIPNRRRDEDFRSNTIFGDPSKIYG